MLSEEEKEAIETIKDFENLKWYEHAFDNGTEVLDEEQKQDIKIILNLIEKQSKEIEALKEGKGYHLGFIDGGIAKRYEMENKIKAKIEEYDDKGMTINLTNRSAGKTFQQAVHYEVKKILQSLLEKE